MRGRARVWMAMPVAVAALACVLASPSPATARSSPHIMLIVMENRGAGAIIGNRAAPFQNALARRYLTLTNWTGVDHPSAPNYVALVTGQDDHRAASGDCTPAYPPISRCDYRGGNLGVQLAAAGIRARWYAEDLRGNGCSIANAQSGLGDVNHEPWAYLPSWQADRRACAEAGLRTSSPGDARVVRALDAPRPPDFVWLTPNLQDDTHDGSIAHGDRYLRALIGAVQRTSWYAHDGTVIVTYDEDEGEANPPGYCTRPIVIGAVGRHCLPTFIVSRAGEGIGRVSTPGDHYGMLRSIERAYGLGLLGNARTARYGDVTRWIDPAAASAARPATAPRPATAVRPLGVAGRWRPIFADDFAGRRLDRARWSTGWFGSGITVGPATEEQECEDPRQVGVDDGLTITAVARAEMCGGTSHPYASGLITTHRRFSFTYGLIQARIRLPALGGRIADWPALWADGRDWPRDGEIDVLEGLDGEACYHFHYAGGRSGGCVPGHWATGWHTYAADWEPGRITFLYDGRIVGVLRSHVTGRPMYLILDLGVSDTISPPPVAAAQLRVAYVRVWQRAARNSAPRRARLTRSSG
jgi:beta-glucanase (GH16 family)